jgi:hypothetical protein
MGRSDRWGALRKPNGVVCSDRLEGQAAVDGTYGNTGLEFGTTGFDAWAGPAEKASPRVSTPVWGGALAQWLKMALGKKTQFPYPVLT